MSKLVHLFDEVTGEYLGSCIAQESPLEPGVYIEPTHSTDLPPIPLDEGSEGQYNHFDGEKWTLKDDTRGIWFKPDRSWVEVLSLTEVIDPTWARIKPTLTQEELDKLVAIEVKNKKVETLNSITVTTSSGKVFDGNEAARNNMISAILSAEFIGQTSAEWKLADNTKAVVTLDEVKEALALSIQRVGEIVMA